MRSNCSVVVTLSLLLLLSFLFFFSLTKYMCMSYTIDRVPLICVTVSFIDKPNHHTQVHAL